MATESRGEGRTARDRAVAEIENDTAILLDGLAGANELAALVRAIDRQRLWPYLVFDADGAAAARDVARVRRALELAHGKWKARRADPLGRLNQE